MEKHLAFLEEVERTPQNYDYSGVCYWVEKHCPKCFSKHGWSKCIANRYEMAWNECLDCGWKGDEEDLLMAGEMQNMKRTELIDKIIDENGDI